jgi:hypothetical protein
MSEHELQLRLRAVARALDADAPAFDPATLRTSTRRRWAVAIAAALAVLALAPAAISALGHLFEVERVPELGPVPADVAPPLGVLGRLVELPEAQQTVAFRLRTIPMLGEPEAVYVRDDIVGGTVVVAYGNDIRLRQWSTAGVRTRTEIVPSTGTAEELTAGRLRALWIEGTARGTFTVTGADLELHKELFDVAPGALLWQDGGVAFLLQGAGTKENAARLAADAAPR